MEISLCIFKEIEILVLSYVDDLIIIAENESVIVKLKTVLSYKFK